MLKQKPKLKPDQVGSWVEIAKCPHPEHDPPNLIYLKPGEILRHICPYCRKESTLIGKDQGKLYVK